MLIKIEKKVIWVLMFRGASAFCGLMTIFLIAKILNQGEQGLFYAILSFLVGQQVFDFGIIQSAYQVSAKFRGESLGYNDTREDLCAILGSNISALIKLGFFIGVVYSTFFMLYFHSVTPIEANRFNSETIIKMAVLMIFTTPLNTCMSSIEGMGNVTYVFKARLIILLGSNAVLWLSLINEVGLESVLYQQIATLALMLCMLINSPAKLFLRLSSAKLVKTISFRNCMQIFSTNLSNYAVFYLPSLILTQSGNVVLAGAFGMTLQIFNASTGFATSWVNSKTYIFAELYQLKKLNQLKSLYFNSFTKSWIALLVIYCVLGMFFYLVIPTSYGERMLPLSGILFLFLSFVGFHFYNVTGPLLQAMMGDPIYKLSILRVFVVAVFALFIGIYDPFVVMLSALVATSLLSIVFCIFYLKWFFKNEN